MARHFQLECAHAGICGETSMTNWNEGFDEIIRGEWRDPETGKAAIVPFKTIRIEETLEGGAADMVAPLKIGKRIAVISDVNTHEAMGKRVAKELKALGTIDEVVFPGDMHCDEPTIAEMKDRTRHADAVVAVGSGSLCDTVKYATFEDGRAYAAFATAASMNGYAAGTASVTLGNGYKTSLPAHAPRGVFVDLKVNADAPIWLSAAGLADSLCRPVAQVEWWGSHRIFGTSYSSTPYILLDKDEPEMIKTAAGLATHDIAANGWLHRVMVMSGFGNVILGASHAGSMGEHQVSHWIDMFAGRDHPGTKHGQQVGVASIALARLHQHLFSLNKPPRVKVTRIVEDDFILRYGDDMGRMMFSEAKKKALDERGVDVINERLAEVWPELREESLKFMIAPEVLKRIIASAGGPTTATELGLPVPVWRKAMKFARDVRNRWSYLDLADDAGFLDEFLSNDPQ
jgi:glycerol-1-phosphate dehydrogenase [NAD(P)+]